MNNLRSIHKIAVLVGVLLLGALLAPPPVRAEGPVTWESMAGPSGGRINAILVNPHNTSLVYAATGAGLFVSQDAGETWTASNTGLPSSREVLAIAISPRDSQQLFVGTYQGIYRSRDGGRTWQETNGGLPQQVILSLTSSPREPVTLYATGRGFVLKSTDNGETWQELGIGLPPLNIWALAFDPANLRILYAATDGEGIYKSSDSGNTWRPANAGLPAHLHTQGLVLHPQVPDLLYIGTTAGVYRSTNGAISWSPVSGGLCNGPVRALALNPLEPRTLYAGISGIGICQSDEGGGTWTVVEPSLAVKPILALTVDPGNPDRVYAGTGDGIFGSRDGGRHWGSLNNGLSHSETVWLAVTSQGSPVVYAGTRWNIYRAAGAQRWERADGDLPSTFVVSFAIDPRRPDILYAGTWNGEIYRSENGGRTWTLASAGFSGVQIIALTTSTAPGDGTSSLFAGTEGQGVFWSRDAGATWKPLNSGLGNLSVDALAAVSGDGFLYAGTGDGLYRLALNTQELRWERIGKGLPAGEIASLAADPQTPTNLYAALGEGIFKSSDGGATWAPSGGGSLPTNARVQTLLVNPRQPAIVYAGTDGGVFRSDDAGGHWTGVNAGLAPASDVVALAMSPAQPDVLYAATRSHGISRGVDHDIGRTPWIHIGLIVTTLSALVIASGVMIYQRGWGAAGRIALERGWPRWRHDVERNLLEHGQVGREMLWQVPRRLRSQVLQRYVDEHPSQDVHLKLDPPRIVVSDPLQVQGFLINWDIASRPDANADEIGLALMRLTEQLAQFLGFSIVTSRVFKDLHGYVVAAPTLRLRVPPRFPIIYIPPKAIGPAVIDDLRDLLGILQMSGFFALLVVLGSESGQILRQNAREATHDLIILDQRDMHSLLLARDRERTLVDIILRQVDLTVISPYVTAGPVPENMFFGREQELKTITRLIRDANFALLGGRKIGKTSILAKVYRLLTDSAEHQPLYLDCQALRDHTSFFEALAHTWDLELPTATPEGFRQTMHALGQSVQGKTLVILLDEVDGLLRADMAQDEPLFRTFRTLAQEGPCRFVLCGEKTLYFALHAPDSPLFNFCNVLPISYLEERDVRRMIVEPMQKMGIILEKPGLLDEIVAFSACHPNVVQYLCAKLIAHISRRSSRTITAADLASVRDSSEFGEYVTEVTWGNASALEKIITLLLLDEPGVTLGEIRHKLHAANIHVPNPDLGRALEGLVLYSILRKEEGTFHFATPSFPQIVKRHQDVPTLLQSLVADVYRTVAPEDTDT